MVPLVPFPPLEPVASLSVLFMLFQGGSTLSNQSFCCVFLLGEPFGEVLECCSFAGALGFGLGVLLCDDFLGLGDLGRLNALLFFGLCSSQSHASWALVNNQDFSLTATRSLAGNNIAHL